MPRPRKVSTIPSELLNLRQWVAWRYETRKGKPTKIPLGRQGTAVDVGDENSWMSHAEATAVPGTDGVGFCFASGYVGVDLDSCRDKETGALEPEALDIIEALGSYAEVSPSGTGVKIILRGKKAEGTRTSMPGTWRATSPDKKPKIEYARYFTVTGDVLPGFDQVTGMGATYFDDLFRDQGQKDEHDAGITKTETYVSDDDLVNVARLFPSTAGIMARLYVAAERGHYNHDESTCDFALCLALARFTADSDQIDRVFRTSRLWASKDDAHKEKWERVDYRVKKTIAKALKEKAAERAKDMGINYRIVRRVETNKKDEPEIEESPVPLTVLETAKQLTRYSNNRIFFTGGEAFLLPKVPGDSTIALDSHDALTGWIGVEHDMCIRWRPGVGFTTRPEAFAGLRFTSPSYHTVENMPTHPLVPGTLYNHPPLPEPDFEALEEWLDFFNWLTPEDRALGKAMFMTPFWGGPGGKRPMFMITAPVGKGVGSGKTTLVEMVAALAGGTAFSTGTGKKGEPLSVDDIKTRLLSPEGRAVKVLNMDNVTGKMSSADMVSLITSSHLSGRQLYEGEGKRPNTIMYCMTVNAPNVDGDFAHRALEIRIARPKEYSDWSERVRRFLSTKQMGVVSAIIALLQKPEDKTVDVKALRFPIWVGQVLGPAVGAAAAQKALDAAIPRQSENNTDLEETELIVHELRLEAMAALTASGIRAVKIETLSTQSVWIFNGAMAEIYNRATNGNKLLGTITREMKRLSSNGDLDGMDISVGIRQQINGQWLSGVQVGAGPIGTRIVTRGGGN